MACLVLLLLFRCHKKESDLANALLQWRNTESALISKEAEHSKLLSEKRNLSDAFSDLQNQLENVCARHCPWRLPMVLALLFQWTCVWVQMKGVLSDAKNQLTSEILRRVEMENQVQTLREQLDLQRNISEQVLHSGGEGGGKRLLGTNTGSISGRTTFSFCVSFRRSRSSEAATRAAWWRWTRGASESLRVNWQR